MKTSTTGFLVIILIAIILFATNPTQSQFNSYVRENLKNELTETSEDNWLYGALKAVFPQQTDAAVASAVEAKTKHADYYVCSIFTIAAAQTEFTFIGVAGKFLLVKKTGQANSAVGDGYNTRIWL